MPESAEERKRIMTMIHDRATAAKKPYGDVSYGDPGYLDADGNQASKSGKPGVKRYPLTPDKVMAAWSYINQAKNAGQYTPEQLAGIKGRIKSAMTKHGHPVAESKAAGPLAIDVVRAVDVAPEYRDAASSDDGLGLLTGRFSVNDTWYPVSSKWEGEFIERTAADAFAQTATDNRSKMRVLFDHGFDPTVGNKVLGPIRSLEPDTSFTVALFDTSYNRDLLPGLKAGVYGSSMRMRVLADTWDKKPTRSEYNPDGIQERTITRAEVLEFGPVTFPANPEATASVRSMTDQFYDQLRQRDSSSYEDAVRAVEQAVPDFTGVPEARSPGRSGSAPEGATVNDRQRLDEGALRLRGILR